MDSMSSLNGKERVTCVKITSVQEAKTQGKNGNHCDKAGAKVDKTKNFKYECCSKIIAVVIVLIAFVSHLVRGASEGKFLQTTFASNGKFAIFC